MNLPLASRGLILSLLLVACSSGTEPTAPVMSSPIATPEAPDATLNPHFPFTKSAVGIGQVDLTAANGGLADFSFAVFGRADGSAIGQFHQKRLRNGLLIEFTGRAICLTTDPAFPGRARIGGIVTQNKSTDPAFMTENHQVGAHVWFRITDGRVSGDPVDASTTYGFKPTLVNTSPEYCALPFTGLPAWNPATIFPLAEGFIDVKP